MLFSLTAVGRRRKREWEVVGKVVRDKVSRRRVWLYVSGRRVEIRPRSAK